MHVAISAQNLIQEADAVAKRPAAFDPTERRLIYAYWRAASYLSVGHIDLYDNPMVQEPLMPAAAHPLVFGHCGVTPSHSAIYVYLNRTIKPYDLAMIYIAGLARSGD